MPGGRFESAASASSAIPACGGINRLAQVLEAPKCLEPWEADR